MKDTIAYILAIGATLLFLLFVLKIGMYESLYPFMWKLCLLAEAQQSCREVVVDWPSGDAVVIDRCSDLKSCPECGFAPPWTTQPCRTRNDNNRAASTTRWEGEHQCFEDYSAERAASCVDSQQKGACGDVVICLRFVLTSLQSAHGIVG